MRRSGGGSSLLNHLLNNWEKGKRGDENQMTIRSSTPRCNVSNLIVCPPLPRVKRRREKREESESAYLCFDFFHQSSLWPHGAPFIQPLNDKEGKAVSWGERLGQNGMLCKGREREKESERKAGRGGRERERRGGRRGRTWEHDHLFLWRKLENWLWRMREGRRRKKTPQ